MIWTVATAAAVVASLAIAPINWSPAALPSPQTPSAPSLPNVPLSAQLAAILALATPQIWYQPHSEVESVIAIATATGPIASAGKRAVVPVSS